MSWKYPENPLRPGSVVEIDDINRNFTKYAEELDGGLNEHNWAKNSFTKSHCTDDVSIETWRKAVEQNPAESPDDLPYEYYRIQQQSSWAVISSATFRASETITTKSTTLWILASLQHRNTGITGEYHGVVQYAIRVDGTVITESITGSSGAQDDIVHHWARDIATPPLGTHSKKRHEAVVFGAGINQFNRGVALDTIVSVSDGTHLIEVVSKMASSGNSFAAFHVGARELIILSLRK